MECSYGNGGWVRFDDGVDAAMVRFAPDDRGRLGVSELYLQGSQLGAGRIDGGFLRRFPVSTLEAIANEDSAVGDRMRLPGPDLARLASYYHTSFGPQAADKSHWVVDSMRAQFPDSGVPQAPLLAPDRPEVRDSDVLRLEPPGPEGLTDNFLDQVRRAYYAAIGSGTRPLVPALAKSAGVSPRTIERWVYEARRRGVMPPGQRGARG